MTIVILGHPWFILESFFRTLFINLMTPSGRRVTKIMKFNITVDRDEDGVWIVLDVPAFRVVSVMTRPESKHWTILRKRLLSVLKYVQNRACQLTLETHANRGRSLVAGLPSLSGHEVCCGFCHSNQIRNVAQMSGHPTHAYAVSLSDALRLTR